MPQPLDMPKSGLPTCTAPHATSHDHLSNCDTTRCHELLASYFPQQEIIPMVLKYRTNPIPESYLENLVPKTTLGARQSPSRKLRADSN